MNLASNWALMAAQAAGEIPRLYLTSQLCDETFAIDVLNRKEIANRPSR